MASLIGNFDCARDQLEDWMSSIGISYRDINDYMNKNNFPQDIDRLSASIGIKDIDLIRRVINETKVHYPFSALTTQEKRERIIRESAIRIGESRQYFCRN